MKKIFVLCLILMGSLYLDFSKLDASSSNEKYYNLIASDNFAYDTNTGIISMKEPILLKANKTYCFVATELFYTDYSDDYYGMWGMGISAEVKYVGETQTFIEQCSIDNYEYYYNFFEVSFTKDAYYRITDFLFRGKTLSELTHYYIFFEGKLNDFQGFRQIESQEDIYCNSNNEYIIYTDVDYPISLDIIKNYIDVIDNVDGNLKLKLQTVSDNYTTNKNKVGIYNIVFNIRDDANNTESLTIKVHVMDFQKPVLDGPAIIEYKMSTPDCPIYSYIIDNYTCYDNVDGSLSNVIQILEINVNDIDLTIAKNYEITLSCKDQSGNEVQKNIILKVLDDILPTIECQDTTFYLSKDYPLNNDKIIANITATDNIGIRDMHAWSESLAKIYSGVPGIYTVTAIVRDVNINESRKNFNITIIDDIKPEFYINKIIATTTKDNVYKEETILRMIEQHLSDLNLNYTNLSIISNNYNGDEVGEYFIDYIYMIDDNLQSEKMKIIVEETPLTSKTKSNTNNQYWWLVLSLIPLSYTAFLIYKRKRLN